MTAILICLPFLRTDPAESDSRLRRATPHRPGKNELESLSPPHLTGKPPADAQPQNDPHAADPARNATKRDETQPNGTKRNRSQPNATIRDRLRPRLNR